MVAVVAHGWASLKLPNSTLKMVKMLKFTLYIFCHHLKMHICANFFFFFFFLGLHPWHMEVPRLRVESEL